MVPVDPDSRDDAGRVRLRCPECNAKLLIKVKAPALKVDDAIPPSDPEPDDLYEDDADDSSGRRTGLDGLSDIVIDTGAIDDPEPEADQGPWVVIVNDLPALEVGELRRVMMRIPRFSRNPNKLHDLTDELPFVLGGITEDEATRLQTAILGMGGAADSGPEAWLLDDDGGPVSLPDDELQPEEGLLIAGDEDDDDYEDELEELEGGALLDVADGDVPAEPAPQPPAAPAPVPVPEPAHVELSTPPANPEPPPPPPPPVEEPLDFGDLVTSSPAVEPVEDDGDDDDDVGLATIDRVPGHDTVLGLVTASVVVSAADLAGPERAGKLAAALEEVERGLRREATDRGADVVLGVKTTSATLPDGSLLLVMQGTASR